MVSRACILFLMSTITVLSGCSVKGSIEEFSDGPLAPIETLSRENPDFISGEVVTSSSGYQGIGVFGEVSEKTSSANSYYIEGAFYE